MRKASEEVAAYLSRGGLPESVTLVEGDELRAFDGVVTRESREPLGSGATVVKFDRSCWPVALFFAAISVVGSALLAWDFLRSKAYGHNLQQVVIPSAMIAFILFIGLFVLLHAGFATRWLVVKETAARFRVRRFLRYRTEVLSFASIREVAIEIIPTRRSELAHLKLLLDGKQVEFLRGQAQDAKGGVIGWTAGLLGAATGLPVINRRFPHSVDVSRRRNSD